MWSNFTPDLPLQLQRRIVANFHQRDLVRLVLVGRHERRAARTEMIGVQTKHVLVELT
jgi:hypothetical protein